MWINEDQEPEASVRERSKDSRVNDGNVIHLGGMGTHPLHTVNATEKYHNFTGFLVQGNSRTVHLIADGSKRAFTSFGDLIDLGYEGIQIFRVPDTFLNLFPDGKDISSNEKYLHAKAMQTAELHSSKYAKDLIQSINEKTILTIAENSRTEAFVFGLPGKITVESHSAYNATNSGVFCRLSHEVTQGRWIKEASCASFGKNNDASFEEIPVGHRCQQSLTVYAKGLFPPGYILQLLL